MNTVKVLRHFQIPGHGRGQPGDVKTVSDESLEYLLKYDVNRPLVELVGGATETPSPAPEGDGGGS